MNVNLSTYAELHCLSNFSFLQAASFPEELVIQAAELGYEALAITDECSLSGIVRAHSQAKISKIKLIIGSEFRLQDGLRVVILAVDRLSYGQLSHLITVARREAKKGEYYLDRELLLRHKPDKCLVLWLPDSSLVTQ